MMAASSRKRFSECEQDINRTSKWAKVHEGDVHYMEDPLLNAKPFNSTYSWRDVITTTSRKTKTGHCAVSWRADKKTVLEYLGESSND